MSFLEYHRKEMELRICKFKDECNRAINNIRHLEIYARSFLDSLPADRSELKQRYLRCTTQIDEFMYLVTDFNLSVSNLENDSFKSSDTYKDPVPKAIKDCQTKTTASTVNFIMYANSSQKALEPQQETHAKQATWPKQALQPNQNPATKPASQAKHVPQIRPAPIKEQARPLNQTWTEQASRAPQSKQGQAIWTEQATQLNQASGTRQTPKEHLMEFSSVSCPAESVTQDNVMEKLPENKNTAKESTVRLALPPQKKLGASVSRATIAFADGANLWLITDMVEFGKLVSAMTEYYNTHPDTILDLPQFSYCAYYDDETNAFFRAIYIKPEGIPEVILADTGECRRVREGSLRPLAERFCTTPAMAHCCHLVNVDLPDNEDTAERKEAFLRNHLWEEYTIKLHMDDREDNSSQGVHVYLEDGSTLNELLARELASNEPTPLNIDPISSSENERSQPDVDSSHSSEAPDNDDDDEGPEYENPLEAVTGYSNRDEVDICKHYKGGPDRTCFKGARCKKRHVMQHPDGWTLDRVPVVATCRPAPLPAPGTFCKVKVTHVRDVNCFYVQFEQEDEVMTLAELVEGMTHEVANAKPLQIEPALGELVAARFDDGRWYRARVLASADDNGKYEVMYIDYGNTSFVSRREMSLLSPHWLSLPCCACACRLAGASGAGPAAAAELRTRTIDRTLQARVIARGYDDLKLELIDLEGFKVVEELALLCEFPLDPYEVEEDLRPFLHLPA